jgi:hypothetical protein
MFVTNYDLKALMHDVDLLCDTADKEQFKNDAINWGDLGCTRAEFYIDDEGGQGYRVTIEEVAPDAIQFKMWLSAQLIDFGYSDVEIVLEW